MARGTGTGKQGAAAQPRGADPLPPWPPHHKLLVAGDQVVFYRASEKDKRGMGYTKTRRGAVAALSGDETGIFVSVADEEDGSTVRVRLHQVAKVNLDGSDPGLPWVHYPNGQESKDDDHCQEWVRSAARWDIRGHQCTFKRKGDSLYCGRHSKRDA